MRRRAFITLLGGAAVAAADTSRVTLWGSSGQLRVANFQLGLIWLARCHADDRLRLGECARSLVRFGVEQKPRNGLVDRRRHARLYLADLT